MMTKTANQIWIIAIVVLLFGSVFVGNIYFNVPIEVFPRLFALLAAICVAYSKIFSRKKPEPPPEPTKEEKLRSYLAACAGLSGTAIIFGFCVGFNVFSYFEKTGKPRSMNEFIAFLIGLPIVIILIYVKVRSIIIGKLSNQEDAPDQKAVR
jgi:hypothetical protein